jgi:hypothetical protein
MSEQLPYRVERTIGGVEIRSYPAMVMATVHGKPDGEAFGILFRYISGNNRPRHDRERYRAGGVKIAMTAPVISDGESFSFVMPPSFSMETTPDPLDPRSVIERVPDRLLAVLKFSGVATARSVEARGTQLLDTLDRHELRYRGDPFLMRYNPPFIPGFMRRNEVGVELVPIAQKQGQKAA